MMYEAKIEHGLMTDEDTAKKTQHDSSKEETRQQRREDLSMNNPNTLVISFDLENVFSLPRTNVSSAFYKCKLNTI